MVEIGDELARRDGGGLMTTHDFIGIGLGPFNLGLACLADPLDELDGVFLEARDDLAWHPGMLLDDATLQVPFLADLVTMADPSSRWSFLSLPQGDRQPLPVLHPRVLLPAAPGVRRLLPLGRRAPRQRPVRPGRSTSVEHVTDCRGTAYVVTTTTGEEFRGRRLVLGVGTQPRVPRAAAGHG